MSRKKKERKEQRLQQRHQAEVRESVERLARKTGDRAKEYGENEFPLLRDPQSVGMRKMSEILLEFARPLVDEAHCFKDQKKALMLAVMAWNLSLVNPISERLESQKMIKTMKSPDAPHFSEGLRAVIRQMVSRKKALYPEIQRLVMDFHYIQTPRGPVLNVTSTVLPGSKPLPPNSNLLAARAPSAIQKSG